MDPFLGEIRAFAFDRIPNGWLPCDGRELTVQQNVALYALLGKRYGGNGTTTFALPDLRGRTPLGWSATLPLAQKDGLEGVALTTDQVPSHTHAAFGSTAAASTAAPSAAALATLPTGTNAYAAPGTTTLNAAAVSTSGGSAPHPNMQPSLVVSWCIATTGLFPSRN